MNIKTLRGQYAQLSSAERFQLVQEAMSRHDTTEENELFRSCPRFGYRMQDAKFWEFYQRGRVVAYLFAMTWLRLKGQVEGAQMAKTAFNLAGHLFEEGFNHVLLSTESMPPENASLWQESENRLNHYEDLTKKAQQAEQQGLAKLKGFHAGFLRFCQAAQLEPHQLLAWVGSLLNEVEAFIKKECADIQEDQEMADFIFDSFTAQWPELKNDKNSL